MKNVSCVRTSAFELPRRSYRAQLCLEHVGRKVGEGVASVVLCLRDHDGDLIISSTCQLTAEEQGAFRTAWRSLTGDAAGAVVFLSPEAPRSDGAWILEELAYRDVVKDAAGAAAH